MLLTAKILLSIVTLGYSVIPTIFDFNDSHATNPSWTGHARYHVVWQVSSYDFIALIALYLTWRAEAASYLWIPILMALAIYGGFWVAWATRPFYGGVLQDEVNGVPDFNYTIFGQKLAVDANVSLFTPLMLLTLILVAIVFGIAAADAVV